MRRFLQLAVENEYMRQANGPRRQTIDVNCFDVKPCGTRGFGSTPGGTRTPNLLIRSQTLYPIELRAQGLSSITRDSAIRTLDSLSTALIRPFGSRARVIVIGRRHVSPSSQAVFSE